MAIVATVRHMGPGTHPGGTPQSAHGKKGEGLSVHEDAPSYELPPHNTHTVVGKRPAEAPEGWILWNAPRPLYGTKTWTGDFQHGVLYAAVDPKDPDADEWNKYNIRMDATELTYVSEDEAVAWAKQYYRDNYGSDLTEEQIESADRRDLLNAFYNEHEFKRG